MRSKTRQYSTFIFTAIVMSAILLFPAISFSDNQAASVMRRGSFRLPEGASVEDVVIHGGIVDIKGEVRGSVFVVDGRLTIYNKAVVYGNITVIAADLKLHAGSIVKGSIFVIGGEISRDEGAVVEGEINVKKDEVSFESRRLLMQYLIFSRPIPEGRSPQEGLDFLSEHLHLWDRVAVANWTEMTINGLPGMAIPANAAQPAKIGLWKRGDWELSIGIARFENRDAAANFWKQLYTGWNKSNLKNAVHVSLGDGSHWFFTLGGRAAAVWSRKGYLMLVEVGPAPGERESTHFAELLRNDVLSLISRKWINQ